MEQKELTNQELLDNYKKAKTNRIVNAVIIGAFIGVAAYSTFKNGLGFFTFFPLFFVYLLLKNNKDFKMLEKELKSRNLL